LKKNPKKEPEMANTTKEQSKEAWTSILNDVSKEYFSVDIDNKMPAPTEAI